MKKLFFVLNLILAGGVVASDVCYILYGGLWLKSITSALFVLIGALNLCFAIKTKSKHLKFSIIMTIGLVFAMAGDIVLNIYFIGGAALFAIGHIIFFLAYCSAIEFSWVDIIAGCCLFIPSLIVLVGLPLFDFGGALMQIVCIVYALIICLMVGKATINLTKQVNLSNIFILVGSVLFFFSDLMLLFDVFGKDVSAIFGILCLATYYPAEILLGYSIFQKANENKK